MPRDPRRPRDDTSPPGRDPDGFVEWDLSPTGNHRRPFGTDEAWQDKPHDEEPKREWWKRPVTLPIGILLAVGGVGVGGGAGAAAHLVDGFIPDIIVTEPELEARLQTYSTEQKLHDEATARKLDAIDRDLTDLHKAVGDLTEILDRAFPRFPDHRRASGTENDR